MVQLPGTNGLPPPLGTKLRSVNTSSPTVVRESGLNAAGNEPAGA